MIKKIFFIYIANNFYMLIEKLALTYYKNNM